MIPPALLVSASIAVGVASLGLALLVVGTRAVRAARQRSAVTATAPHRSALLLVASGDDEGGAGLAHLLRVSSPTWRRLEPAVVALVSKVRGKPADDLVGVLRAHGEVDRALAMLGSRSAVRRARAAYLLGLVKDRDYASRLLPLLGDRSAEVRMVTVRALGMIGDPAGAAPVLSALVSVQGQVGVPAHVAAEALLSMGSGTALALREGLTSDDAVVRAVSALVAGHSNLGSAAPRLRDLVREDPDPQVRITAATSLGLVGRADDIPTLVAGTAEDQPTPLRRACAAALGELGHPLAVDPLVGLLSDPDRRLAQVAGAALVHLGLRGLAALAAAGAGAGHLGGRAAQAALVSARLRGIPVPAPS